MGGNSSGFRYNPLKVELSPCQRTPASDTSTWSSPLRQVVFPKLKHVAQDGIFFSHNVALLSIVFSELEIVEKRPSTDGSCYGPPTTPIEIKHNPTLIKLSLPETLENFTGCFSSSGWLEMQNNTALGSIRLPCVSVAWPRYINTSTVDVSFTCPPSPPPPPPPLPPPSPPPDSSSKRSTSGLWMLLTWSVILSTSQHFFVQ